MARKLAVVGPDTKAKDALTVLAAAEIGNRLEELRAMRRRIAAAIDSEHTRPVDLAALSRRQLEIGREIDALAIADTEASVVADLEVESWDGTGY